MSAAKAWLLQLLRVTQLGRNGISLTCGSSLNACCAA